MGIPPEGDEDILAFGRADPPARVARKRWLLGAVGGSGLAGAAVAVGLLAVGGGAAPVAHHQDTLTQYTRATLWNAIPVTQAVTGELVSGATQTFALPAGSGRVVTLNPGTGRPTCHH